MGPGEISIETHQYRQLPFEDYKQAKAEQHKQNPIHDQHDPALPPQALFFGPAQENGCQQKYPQYSEIDQGNQR